ncbi:ATP-dependent metalloprotease FtsH, partial [Emiliania huxleyi CCMP1516]
QERLEAAQNELGVPLRDHVPVAFVSQRSWASEAASAGRYVPSLLLIGFLVAMSRGALGGGIGGMGGGGGLFNVGKSKAIKASKVQTRFKDVAGLQESKAEVMEFVDILQNPERYTKLGAKIPKGALLVGPPGCGKTLLAKATAGESKAPFYSISGSDFIEMFVGVGPARVRDLFAQARANAPCLIFIDEIDAVGRARGKGGFNGGNDERENTLNQLLIELDGFSPSSGECIVVLAGTNRADVLDPALLRPGRFDRQIVVDKPDITGRAEIFRLDADSESWSQKMAALTPGFSGAEIANVCNEAALIAARRSESVVTAECFDAAIDRVIAGIEKKDLTIDPYERRVVAFHEAGHALCGWLLEHADPVMKVSIVPRGQSALGYSQSLPRDVPLYTEGQLDDMMCMALGGRAAEQVAPPHPLCAPPSPRSPVTVYGLSSRVGPLSFGQQEESNTLYRPYSEKTARVIDEEVSKIIDASYERAVSLLTEHRDKLTALAESLLEKEVIGSDDLIRVLGERPFSKSVDYDEFVNASWKRKLETADDAGEDAGGGGGGGSGGGGGEELPPAQAAA